MLQHLLFKAQIGGLVLVVVPHHHRCTQERQERKSSEDSKKKRKSSDGKERKTSGVSSWCRILQSRNTWRVSQHLQQPLGAREQPELHSRPGRQSTSLRCQGQ